MSKRTWPRLIAFVCLLAGDPGSMTAIAADSAAEARLPVIHFHNGDFAAGELVDSADGEAIQWRSAAFAAPLRFPLGVVQSVQFPLAARPQPPEGPYCFELAGGDLLYGSLLALDERQATLDVPGLGKLLVDRAALHRFYRAGAADLVYAGPVGLDGWIVSGAANAWRDEGGQLTTDQPGAALRRDFHVPTARYEIKLSWKARPGFELALGVNDDPQSARSAFRFEVWDDELVVLRETDRLADVCALQKLPPGAGSCHFHVWLDQEQGRLLVFSAAGEKLADLLVPDEKKSSAPVQTKGRPQLLLQARPRKQPLPGGFQLVNRRGDIKLERLTISRWSGAVSDDALSQTGAAGNARIHLVDAALRYADLSSYDASTRQFVLIEQGQEQRLDERQVQDVVLNKPGEAAPRSLQVLAAWGARISGELLKVEQGRIWLQCPAIGEPVSWKLNELHALIVLKSQVTKPAAAHEGRLELAGTLLHGDLVDSTSGETAGLLFQSRHTDTATPLAREVSARLIYRDPPPKPVNQPPIRSAPNVRIVDGVRTLLGVRRSTPARPITQPGQCILHLRSGDKVPCQVRWIDESGLSLKSDRADANFVPHSQIKVLELLPDAQPVKIDKAKWDRLLTLPRMQRDNPPTQLIRSLEGDYLRGRLVAMDDNRLQVEVRLETKPVPRDQVARIIWLHADEIEGSAVGVDSPTSPTGMRVQAVPRDGNRLTFFAQELQGRTLSGRSQVLGACHVELNQVDQLLFGETIEEAASSLAFHQWKLKHAEEPLPEPEAGETGSEGLESVLVGKPAPEIELDLLDGRKFRLADHKDKIVVLDFWASWCGPCLQVMPQVDQVAREFAEQDVELVAINLQENPERIRTALSRLKLETVVAMDRDGRVAERYGATAIPQTVIIDREGKVARLFVGGSSRFGEQLRQALKAVLSPASEQPE